MRILHLIDTLSTGGAERVAVNLVNLLNHAGIETYLCATRREGPLRGLLVYQDRYLFLDRRTRFDVRALLKLVKFIKDNRIGILHAHSSSFFIAVLAKVYVRRLGLVWHDHYGLSDQLELRSSGAIRLASLLFDGVFSVNLSLRAWAIRCLFVKPDRVAFLPNYADLGEHFRASWHVGRMKDHCILCLANLRPQKDHTTLLRAFALVKTDYKDAKLYLVGRDWQDVYSQSLRELVSQLKIKDVYFMGEQADVVPFLNTASVAVLSSFSEGLPISLLEYSLAGLPVICTDVGHCGMVLKDGEAGWLVPARDANALSTAIIDAFSDPVMAQKRANLLYENTKEQFSPSAALLEVNNMYRRMQNGGIS